MVSTKLVLPPVRDPSTLANGRSPRGTHHRAKTELSEALQARRDSLATIAAACQTIERSRRLIDRSVALALETEMKCGIRPPRGGFIERLLSPGSDDVSDIPAPAPQRQGRRTAESDDPRDAQA